MGGRAPVLLGDSWGKLVDHEPQSAPPVQAAVAVDRSRKARWRLGRSVLPLVGMAIALCVVVVWQRDARHIEAERQRIRHLIEPLRRYVREIGTLPGVFPSYVDLPASAEMRDFTYVDEQMIRWCRNAERAIVVGYGRSQGLIGTNGHVVVIYENGELRDDWVSNRQLGQLLAEQKRLSSGTAP